MAAFSLGAELGAIIVKTLEKIPKLKDRFVVSELLLKRLPEAARPTPTARAVAEVLGIELPVAVYEFPKAAEAAKAWGRLVLAFEGCDLAVCAGRSTVGTAEAPALVLKDPLVEERYLDDDDDKAGVRATFRSTIRVDCEAVGRFSRAVGLEVRYCLGRYLTQPPFLFEAGTVNIHLGARPPGNYRSHSLKVRELFGCKVWSDGEERMVHGPVQWRGHLLSAEGIPVIQVIGNNYYQLALMHSEHGNGFDRSKLWEKTLALIAGDLAAEPPEAPEEATPEDVEAGVRGMTDRNAGDLRDALRKIEFELGDLQKLFAEKLRQRDEKVALLKTLQRETDDVAERCAEDFARLKAMPDVTLARIDAENGLYVETVPVALERDNRRYDLGPFRIQIAPDGAIATWSDAPRHPKGHHHPHVDRVSLECFGDVTLAVTKLATGYRFADAVQVIMRCLRSYHPETTLIPLEEFPSEPIPAITAPSKGTARDQKKNAELLRTAQAHRPPSDASGDPDRRRDGGKPRRGRPRKDGGAETRRLGRR